MSDSSRRLLEVTCTRNLLSVATLGVVAAVLGMGSVYAQTYGTTFVTIYSIQGSGPSAAVTGAVTTEGIVVGDFEGTAAASGFYLQDPAGDSNAATSDGIFVYTGAANLVSVGQAIRVTGVSSPARRTV